MKARHDVTETYKLLYISKLIKALYTMKHVSTELNTKIERTPSNQDLFVFEAAHASIEDGKMTKIS